MKRLFLFLTIALGFVAQARAGGIDTLWTKPYDYMVGSFSVIAINHDSTIVAVGSKNGYVKLYDINTGDSLACFSRQDSAAYTLSFSPDAKHFAYGFSYAGVSILNLTTMKIDTTFSDMKKIIYSNKDSNIIYINEHNLKLLNKDDFTVLKTLELTDTISNMFISQDYSKAVIVERHETKPLNFYHVADIVSLDSFKILKRINIGNYYNIQFSPDGKEIAVADEGRIDFYNVETGKITRTFTSGSQYIWSVAFPSEGGYFATGVKNPNHIQLVNSSTMEIVRTVDIPVPELTISAYTPLGFVFGKDNKKLLCAGNIISCVDISNFSPVIQYSTTESILHPNPTTGNIIIDIENISTGSDIVITNISGEKVICQNSISEHQITVYASSLPAGVYFVRINTSTVPQTYKFVKE